MTQPDTKTPPLDTRVAQAERAADWLECNPMSTGKEIDAACDVGSVSKLLSEMPRMGYGIGKDWRYVPCASGTDRRVRTYTLLYRPSTQPDLFREA